MYKIGTYLKDQRNKCGLSLKDVYKQCGVTDSKLSRVEREEGKILTPIELKKLAQLYGIDLIPLYIMAGYLDESDLQNYRLIFKDADLLSDEEKQGIQIQINLLTKGRRVSNNDI